MSISFLNQSSIATDDFQKAMAAISEQLANEYAAVWGTSPITATITVVDQPGPGDPSGALGYHDVLSDGTPYGKVFAQLAEQNGIPWSVVASHEGLELAADPRVNTCVYLADANGTSGWLAVVEICDPVEMQSYKSPDGTPLSNFVYPTWFVPGHSGQVDHLKLLASGLHIASGGYAEADYVLKAQGWQSFGAFLASKKGKLS